ncbi:MAG TPA: hypothetical protein VH008_20210, partial [Pseudonocardia sp.]|nr:hypothetical protein [Pseudonocardia sp.]
SYLRSGGADPAGGSTPDGSPPGYQQGAPTPGGYPPGYQPSAYPQGGPAPAGFPDQQLSGYPPGYPQGPYPPPGYAQSGYPQSAYPAPGYPHPDYPQAGYQGYPGYPDGGAVAPPNDPLVPGDFAGWFQKIIGVVQRSWKQLGLIQVILAVVSAIYAAIAFTVFAPFAEYTAQLSAGQQVPPPVGVEDILGSFFKVALAGMVVVAVICALLFPASLFVVIRDAAGQPTTLGEALRFGGRRMLATVGWGALSFLMISLGTLLFIIPGIYLGIVIGATLLGVIVVERGGVGRCFALVNPRFWATTGRMVVLWLIYAVYYLVTQSAATAIGGPLSVTTGVLAAVLIIPLGIFLTAAVTVTYAELRFRENPRVTTSTLAAEMAGAELTGRP